MKNKNTPWKRSEFSNKVSSFFFAMDEDIDEKKDENQKSSGITIGANRTPVVQKEAINWDMFRGVKSSSNGDSAITPGKPQLDNSQIRKSLN